MHHFYYPQNTFEKILYISDKNFHKQLSKVLKLQINEKIILFNNIDYKKYIYSIHDINKKEIILKLENIINCELEKNNLHLYIAIGKKDKLEFICQKASEIGVKTITPIITQRTIKLNYNEERLKKIIIEACEQSEQCKIVKLNDKIKLDKLIKNINDNQALNLIMDPHAKNFINKYQKIIPQYKNINIFIGPEGGFSPEEIQKLKELNNSHNLKILKNILRMETASIAALAIIKNYLYFYEK